MDLLLDTHAFLWWLSGNTKLSVKARHAIASGHGKFVSAATVWEIVTKYRLGKLPGVAAVAVLSTVWDAADAVTAPVAVCAVVAEPPLVPAVDEPITNRW